MFAGGAHGVGDGLNAHPWAEVIARHLDDHPEARDVQSSVLFVAR